MRLVRAGHRKAFSEPTGWRSLPPFDRRLAGVWRVSACGARAVTLLARTRLIGDLTARIAPAVGPDVSRELRTPAIGEGLAFVVALRVFRWFMVSSFRDHAVAVVRWTLGLNVVCMGVPVGVQLHATARLQCAC